MSCPVRSIVWYSSLGGITCLFGKVHIFWEGHKNFAKSSPNFWPINLCSLFPATVLNSSLCLSGSQSWNLIHWDGFWSISCLSVSNIPNIAKTWQCLECLSNLLKIQNWAGNTEKQVIGQKLGEDFTKFCGLLRIYELYLHDGDKYDGALIKTNLDFFRP